MKKYVFAIFLSFKELKIQMVLIKIKRTENKTKNGQLYKW